MLEVYPIISFYCLIFNCHDKFLDTDYECYIWSESSRSVISTSNTHHLNLRFTRMATALSFLTPSAAQLHITITKDTRIASFFSLSQEKLNVLFCVRLPRREGTDKSKGRLNKGRREGVGRGRKSKFPALTIEAGEVSPVEQGAVEGGQGDVEEQIGAIGWVSDGVCEQVHLQQGLEQIAQHLAAQRGTCAPF